jgi:cytochrome c oxidase subunit 4
MSEYGSANLPGTYGPEHVVREQPGVDPHHDGDDHGHGGVGKYLVVFAALCVLTGASFFTYTEYWPFKDDKQITWAFMMAVSCTKAMLVIMFFMHLLWEANWKWVLTIPASFMSIFLMLMLVPDIGWRQNNGFARYSDDRLLFASDRPESRSGDGGAGHEQRNESPAGDTH